MENPAAASRFDGVSEPLLQAAAAEVSIRNAGQFMAQTNASIRAATTNGRTDLYVRYLEWLWSAGTRIRDKTPEGMAYALGARCGLNRRRRRRIPPASRSAPRSSPPARATSRGPMTRLTPSSRTCRRGSLLAVEAAAGPSAQYSLAPRTAGRFPKSSWGRERRKIGRALAAQEYSAESAGYRLLISYRKDLAGCPWLRMARQAPRHR